MQDWYAHTKEGYTSAHTIDTFKAADRDHRVDTTIMDNFFDRINPYLNPYVKPLDPHHSKEEVERNVGLRNLGINVLALSESDLVDLYLRYDLDDPYKETRMKERAYAGFDTDKYIEGSKRDRAMYEETSRYVDKFLIVYLVNLCEED